MQNASVDSQVWWRNGYVWMVLGGPAVVVVAAIATAINTADFKTFSATF